jgi:endonuclease YncB( thermonuclease family)
MRRISMIIVVTVGAMLTAPVGANTLVVAEVHPGCIVEFEGGYRVHLAGISIADADSEIGRAAYDFVKRRLKGKRVAVFTWTTDNTAAGIVYGEDGLAFARIMYGDEPPTDIASELLKRGFARVDPAHLPEGYKDYWEIERRAEEGTLGLWATGK